MFGNLAGSSQFRLPAGTRIYAIGDIHGRVDLLDQLQSQIDSHLALSPVDHPIEVYLGDYIDRGPSSKDVIDRLIARKRQRRSVFLRGNHEAFLLESLRDTGVLGVWQKYGALPTLQSYGVESARSDAELQAAIKRSLPKPHQSFLKGLKPSFSLGGYFFVHAGVRPGIKLRHQTEEDLLWIREDFLLYEQDFEKIIVHGHTPVAAPDLRSNRINIDTGAFKTGRLSCVVLEKNEVAFLQTS